MKTEPSLFSESELKQNTCSHPTKPFTFIDLFAGIGGFRKGLEACGGKCIFSCEKDKYARTTYEANYKCETEHNHKCWDDITTLDEKTVPDHDILCAGFPCQSFSLAGIPANKYHNNNTGLFAKGKGNLFFDVIRIINEKKPKVFMLENVKNLLSHDGGKTFETIRIFLEQYLKYHIQWRVIDAKYFVPQSRKRIIILGFREKTNFDFEGLKLPANDNNITVKDILEKNVDDKYTLSDKRWAFLQHHRAKHQKLGNGFGYKLANLNSHFNTLCSSYGASSSTFIAQEGKNPRRLTPRECNRIMGFDTPRGHSFQIPVSDSKAYKQFGNAIVPGVVEWVGRGISKILSKNI